MKFLSWTIYFSLISLFLVACGRRPASTAKIVYANSTSSSSTSSVSTVTNPFVGDGTGSRCEATLSTNYISAYADASGNFIASYLPPAVNVTLRRFENGSAVSFSTTNISYQASQLQFEGEPVTNVDFSKNYSVRPLKGGVHTFTFSTSATGLASVSCTATLTVATQSPPALDVAISANGARDNLATALASGSMVRVMWASVNATSCQIEQNGSVIPGYTSTSGEFYSDILVNDTAYPKVIIFTAKCFGNSNAVKTSNVSVRINPMPQMVFSIDGATGDLIQIRSGSSVTLRWNAQYASGGCTLSDQVRSGWVPTAAAITFSNITSSLVFTLRCSDSYQGIIEKIARVKVVNPTVVITANGIEGSLPKPYGQNVTIAWQATDMDSCTLSPLNMTGLSGSVVILSQNLTAETVYTVSCQGAYGSISASIRITIPSRWYQVSGQACPSFCASMGKANLTSPEGARCASGETRPASAFAAGISFSYGCWRDCSPVNSISTFSVGSRCYAPGQKQDNDRTDNTVGCFCG